MSQTDYRDALRLLNEALAIVERRDALQPDHVRRRIRRLSLELDLLRVRLRQPAAYTRRN